MTDWVRRRWKDSIKKDTKDNERLHKLDYFRLGMLWASMNTSRHSNVTPKKRRVFAVAKRL